MDARDCVGPRSLHGSCPWHGEQLLGDDGAGQHGGYVSWTVQAGSDKISAETTTNAGPACAMGSSAWNEWRSRIRSRIRYAGIDFPQPTGIDVSQSTRRIDVS